MLRSPLVTSGLAAFSAMRDAFDLLWSQTDSFVKRRLALASLLIVSSAILAALAPIALKLAIDAFSKSEQQRTSLAPAMLVCAYVLSLYLARLLGELRMLAHGRGEQRLQRRLSRRLFAHVMSLPLRFHLDRKSGAVGQTLTSGLLGYQIVLQHLIYTILPVGMELLTISVVLIHLDHAVYLVILGLAAVLYLAAFTLGSARIAEPARAVSAAHIDAHAVLTDSLLNYETVKYFNAESVVSNRYDGALSETESHWAHFYRHRTSNGLIVATIFAASLGTSLVYAAREVLQGTMTMGEFVLVNAYMQQIVRPLEMLGNAMRDLSQGLAFLHKMLGLFREKPERDAAVQPTLPSEAGGMLVFDRVSLSYRPGRTVLRDVSFSVPPGQSLAIVGPSGSGKSSLIRLLFRLYEPDRGQILLDGVSIAEWSLSCLRRAIAVVPQDTVLFNDTIGSNIGFGKHGSTHQEIEDAARLAHLHEFIMSLPEGYDTIVGERGIKLSGGERQRVAIARAALKRPRIYVFDEATSSLDSRTERGILSNLAEVSNGCTTLVIAHRLSTVVRADEVVVLDHGTVIERGTHASLLHLTGSYAAMWRAQQMTAPINDARIVSIG